METGPSLKATEVSHLTGCSPSCFLLIRSLSCPLSASPSVHTSDRDTPSCLSIRAHVRDRDTPSWLPTGITRSFKHYSHLGFPRRF